MISQILIYNIICQTLQLPCHSQGFSHEYTNQSGAYNLKTLTNFQFVLLIRKVIESAESIVKNGQQGVKRGTLPECHGQQKKREFNLRDL